jgi:pimeloyl-ACP methyl ester carboxylesterase
MKSHLAHWFSMAVLLAAAAGCSSYSSARKTRLSYEARTPAGELIASGLRNKSAPPSTRAGTFLDAAHLAATALKKQPDDPQALADYNFAVSRVVETVHDAELDLTSAAVCCVGATGDWQFSVKKPKAAGEHTFADFRVVPADRYKFKGRLVRDRVVKEGLGAPLVVNNRGFDPLAYDPFAQGRRSYYGLTSVIDFNGQKAQAKLLDPLASESVTLDGNRYPLAADFTAPIGLSLAELKPRRAEIQRFLNPKSFSENTRLARLQPYDPNKIPLLCIHGLGDSQATWAPMIEALRGDPVFRQNYQVWFFSYPTGYPYPLMAAMLREKMDAMSARYRDHKPIVVIGHSMGGMIARTLMTDSGMTLWNTFFESPPDQTPLSTEAKELLTKSMIFKPRRDVSRIILMSASLRGADMATSLAGRLGRGIIGSPRDLADIGSEMRALAKPAEDGKRLRRTPNSIDVLDPNSRFLQAINEIPVVKGIPYHSIIGDRGKGGNPDRTRPQSTDGIVPYWSSHIDGAASEVIIPSGHWSNRHPDGIAEVKRILHEHLWAGGK